MTTSVAATASTHVGVRRPTSVLAWVNLIGQIVIVFTGGLVRLTGSGLGCTTWPQCHPGSFTPVPHDAASYHQYIEFGNRTLTGVLVVIAVALAWFAWHERGRTIGFKWLATTPLIMVAVQAVVGGMSVWTDLSPVLVGFHLLLSVGLVWLSATIVARSREGDGPIAWLVDRQTRSLGWALTVVFVPMVILGVITTGSGPHSGDDKQGYRFAVDPALAAQFHGAVVALFAILLVLFLVRLAGTGAPAPTRRAAWWLAGTLVLQAAIGIIQFIAGLPVPLVALHLLGVALTTTTLSFALLAERRRGALVEETV